MDKPKIQGAPGLAWRPRGKQSGPREADRWVATWVARADIVKKGFTPETQRFGEFNSDLTETEIDYLKSECNRLQDEMLAFGRGGSEVAPLFDGTIKGLSQAYQRDEESPLHTKRYRTKRDYIRLLGIIERSCGARALAALNGRDFKRWYKQWRWPAGEGIGKDHVYTAHDLITMVRTLFSFGIAFEIEPPGQNHCARLKAILSELEFENGSPRTEAIDADQCAAIIKASHELGRPSVGLAQALQFELVLRQKDVIGEWVPLSEPGVSEVTHAGKKWLYGLRWEEVDSNLILKHKLSKSGGKKMVEFDLKLYPMIMAEIARIPEDRRSGPMVINENIKRPWKSNNFRDHWRAAATKAGVPKSIKNMDSRAGGTTETIEATGGNIEAARKQAAHSKAETTQRYSRKLLKSNSEVAVLRAKSRTKNE